MRIPRTILKFTLAALAALAWSACGSDDAGSGGDSPGGSGGGSPSTGQALVMKNFNFQPSTLEVPAGATVMVKNEDGDAHTATADDRSFDTGNIEGMGQKEITVTKAGQIAYKCDIHPYMTGVIQVSGS